MKLQAFFYSSIIIMAFIGSSCSSQRLSSSDSDGIYYSSEDRFKPENEEFNKVKEVNGEDYKSSDDYSSNYYSIGKEENQGQNPNASMAYAESLNQDNRPDTEESGATINNFYGNTNYSEGDYYEEDYASRIRRFDSYGVNQNYGYYDPFYVDPYWNYGWSAWNPYPVGGWNVGYSTWGGWNVGYNWGWGGVGYGRPWYNQPLWYRYSGNYAYWDYWSYGYGWGGYGCYPSPFYNGPFYGGAYSNGYWNGYQNGFSDGYYTGNQNNRRPSYNGRRQVAGNDGFSDNLNDDSRRNDAMNTRVDQVSNAGTPRADELTAFNESISDNSSNKRVSGFESIYQSDASVKARQNANAKEAATKYGAQDRVNAQSKYVTGASTVASNNQKVRTTTGAQQSRTGGSANGQSRERAGASTYQSTPSNRVSSPSKTEVRTTSGSRYQSTNRTGATRTGSSSTRTSTPQSYRGNASSSSSRATPSRSTGRSGAQNTRSSGSQQRSSSSYNRSGSSTSRSSARPSSQPSRSSAGSRPSSSSSHRSGSYSGGSSRSGASTRSSSGGSTRSGASSSRSSGGRR